MRGSFKSDKLLIWFDTNFLVVLVVAVFLFFVTLNQLASRVDELAVQREQNQMENSLKDTIIEMAAQQTTIAVWDDAITYLDNHYNLAWADTNIGHFFCTSQGLDYVFILDSQDQPIYAMRDNQNVALSSFEPFQRAAQSMAATIRQRESARGPVFKARLEGGIVSQPIQATDLVKIGDDLVITTFNLVQPDFGKALPDNPRSAIIVTGKRFDARLLKHFSDRLVLTNLELTALGHHVAARVLLKDQTGNALGQLGWKPYRPAEQLIESAIVPIVIAIGMPLALYFYSRGTARRLRSTLTDLRASEERWSFALEGSGEGVWDWDLISNKVQLSKQFKAMLGYQENELGDDVQTWLHCTHPDDQQRVAEAIQENRVGLSHSFSIEHRVVRKDGTEIWVLNRGMTVNRDPSRLAQRMVGTLSDISGAKQMELMKSQFISSVSHELRTPVTSIRGSLGLLESGVLGTLPAKAQEMVAVAHKNSLRLLNLINDILDMDKLLSGAMTIRADPIDLVDLVKQSIEANAAYGQSYQVRFELTELVEGVRAVGDPDRLMQVLANILSNAAKFSKPGSAVQIRISTEAVHARVEVEDTGPGIPAEFEARIFTPFAQASTGNTRKQGGTGLGLNISKKLVEHMNGQIGYITMPDSGTIFWFTVPTHHPEQPDSTD